MAEWFDPILSQASRSYKVYITGLCQVFVIHVQQFQSSKEKKKKKKKKKIGFIYEENHKFSADDKM